MPPTPVITLTTDFGTTDPYAGSMKGVVLGLAPEATLVDLSHDVRPHNVAGAAYLLEASYRYFPSHAIHLGVVDPGVGTSRRPLLITTPHGTYVGPDNGIFSWVLSDQQLLDMTTGELSGCQAVVLDNEEYWRQPVSPTFHGRDIFAPVAAHLALETSPERFGSPCDTVRILSKSQPHRTSASIDGKIIHVDRFGNAVSNIRVANLPASPLIEAGDLTLSHIAASFQEDEITAICGSTGLLEIAARNARATDLLNLRVGDEITVRSSSA